MNTSPQSWTPRTRWRASAPNSSSTTPLIYLDGNSLGRLPLTSVEMARDLVERTVGARLIRSWNEGWFDLPARIGGKLAALLGAQADEVVIADSTSVNLFKLAVAALRHQHRRTRILTDDLNFPSDLYVLQGAVEMLGGERRLEIVPSPDSVHGQSRRSWRIWTTTYRAGRALAHTSSKAATLYDMAAITRRRTRRARWCCGI
jgi:kynureninase